METCAFARAVGRVDAPPHTVPSAPVGATFEALIMASKENISLRKHCSCLPGACLRSARFLAADVRQHKLEADAVLVKEQANFAPIGAFKDHVRATLVTCGSTGAGPRTGLACMHATHAHDTDLTTARQQRSDELITQSSSAPWNELCWELSARRLESAGCTAEQSTTAENYCSASTEQVLWHNATRAPAWSSAPTASSPRRGSKVSAASKQRVDRATGPQLLHLTPRYHCQCSSPQNPQQPDHFRIYTWSNVRTLFRSGLPNFAGGTATLSQRS